MRLLFIACFLRYNCIWNCCKNVSTKTTQSSLSGNIEASIHIHQDKQVDACCQNTWLCNEAPPLSSLIGCSGRIPMTFSAPFYIIPNKYLISSWANCTQNAAAFTLAHSTKEKVGCFFSRKTTMLSNQLNMTRIQFACPVRENWWTASVSLLCYIWASCFAVR